MTMTDAPFDIASIGSTMNMIPRSGVCGLKAALVFGTCLAMVFSILAVSHCNFVTTEGHTLGLFRAAQYDGNGNFLGCLSIEESEIEIDGLFRNARAFGTLTALLSTASFVLLLFSITFHPSNILWVAIRIMLSAATVFSMFVFTVVGSSFCSEEECRISGVGILNIFNTFLLASLSTVTFIDTPPEHPIFTVWTDDLFTQDKDTLVSDGEGAFPEYFSREDARRIAEAIASDGGDSVDILEMEIVDGEPQFVNGGRSVLSDQPSIQESMMIALSLQRSKAFRYSVVAMIVLMWSLTIFGVRRCTFIDVSAKADPNSQKFGMGIFSRAVYQEGEMLGCLAYQDEAKGDFSFGFKVSRVAGTIAAFLMTAVLLCGVLQLFTTIAKELGWLFIRTMVSVSLVFQLLTFVAFRSEICTKSDVIECSIGGAGKMAIFNSILLLGFVILSCILPPPANPVFARWRPPVDDDGQHQDDQHHRNLTERGIAIMEKGRPIDSKLSVVQEGDETDTEMNSEVCADDVPMAQGAETIIVRVEFGPGEKKTIKEIVHPDGSKTITTTIEDVNLDVEDEETVDTRRNAQDDDMDEMSLNLDPDIQNIKIIL
jgi:hypothetical protein